MECPWDLLAQVSGSLGESSYNWVLRPQARWEQEVRKPQMFPSTLALTRTSPVQNCWVILERQQGAHSTSQDQGGGIQSKHKTCKGWSWQQAWLRGRLGWSTWMAESELEMNSTGNSWRQSFWPRSLDQGPQQHLGTCKAWDISATPPHDWTWIQDITHGERAGVEGTPARVNPTELSSP